MSLATSGSRWESMWSASAPVAAGDMRVCRLQTQPSHAHRHRRDRASQKLTVLSIDGIGACDHVHRMMSEWLDDHATPVQPCDTTLSLRCEGELLFCEFGRCVRATPHTWSLRFVGRQTSHRGRNPTPRRENTRGMLPESACRLCLPALPAGFVCRGRECFEGELRRERRASKGSFKLEAPFESKPSFKALPSKPFFLEAPSLPNPPPPDPPLDPPLPSTLPRTPPSARGGDPPPGERRPHSPGERPSSPPLPEERIPSPAGETPPLPLRERPSLLLPVGRETPSSLPSPTRDPRHPSSPSCLPLPTRRTAIVVQVKSFDHPGEAAVCAWLP